MGKQITGGRYIAETIHSLGISHVFFMDAILRKALVEMEELGIRRILAHSEKAAAYMADGYARISGKPAVCMSQSVGAANLAAGLQDAFLGQSPVIALTGRQPARMQYRNAYQELPHEPFFRALTKSSACIELPEQLPLLLRQAFRTATTGQPGPVHLDIAGHTGDIIGSGLLTEEGLDDPHPHSHYPLYRAPADSALVEKAADYIRQAQRPVLVADIGVMRSGAESALRELANKLSIPVVASLDAKAVMTESEPLYAGIVGTYSSDSGNRTVDASDLVIFVGSNVGDQITNNWRLPHKGVKTIQIYSDPAELGRNIFDSFGLPGDPLTILKQLTSVCQPAERNEWVNRVQTFVAEWRAGMDKYRSSAAVPVRPERLCKEVGSALPTNGVLVADTGYSSHWSGTLVRLEHPEQQYFRASGSLGWGFPASLGMKCARPDLPVVCFTGDGGFMYHMPELETARRWSINTITVVNNNACLAQGARAIEEAYRGRNGDSGEIHNFMPINFARVAEEMGCVGIRVEHGDEYADAFATALKADAPVVIDVVTDPSALAPLPWESN